MTATETSNLDRISEILAERGYSVERHDNNILSIREVDSGVVIQAALQMPILFFSLPCLAVREEKLTTDVLRRMLAADSGISTSHFQLYPAADGEVSISLNNFCTLQSMSEDDQDDILSCVHYLMVDVLAARHLLSDLLPETASTQA